MVTDAHSDSGHLDKSSPSRPHAEHDSTAVSCAVLTVSDTRVPANDQSGQLMQAQLVAARHSVSYYQIVRDEPEQIVALIEHLATRADIQAILLNGGTGIAPRDTTYDAIAPLLTKELPGFGEIFRQLSYAEIGSRAMASRAIAGVFSSKLIFSVPGSSKAVRLAMESLILPELSHLTSLLK
jgi:molybdopterin adenylyltransferase